VTVELSPATDGFSRRIDRLNDGLTNVPAGRESAASPSISFSSAPLM